MNESPELAITPAAPDQPIQRNARDNVRASWPYSTDNIRATTSHFAPEETELLIKLFLWCTDPQHPMRQEDAAQRLGFSTAMLYQLFTGRYRNPDKTLKRPSEEFLKAVHEFLKLESERCTMGKNDFVMTPTAKRICTAFDLARESQTIVFLWGPSQIGKTWAAEKFYTPNNNHGRTIYCRMNAATGVIGLLRTMARAIGIAETSNGGDLIRRIKNATSPNTLWILDELHLLANTYRKGSFFAAMEIIREIHDESHCGMAWLFTILDDVKAASQKELQQCWRRGVHKVPLPLMPTKGDLAAILKHHGLDFPAARLEITVGGITERPYEILRQQAKDNGLKVITERLRYAHKLADRSNAKTMTWDHFVEAHLLISKQAVQEGEWA